MPNGLICHWTIHLLKGLIFHIPNLTLRNIIIGIWLGDTRLTFNLADLCFPWCLIILMMNQSPFQ